MEIFKNTILLNSRSPRRKQILQQMGFTVEIVDGNCEENFDKTLSPQDIVVYLAQKKANAYQGIIKTNQILIAADTIVVNDNQILGKPTCEQQAIDMLKSLSNKKHLVITGCCLKNNDKNICFYEQTEVIFDELSQEEFLYYVETYKPLDKAGSYGVQEWIGMIGIKKLYGDYYNVMGLPAHKLWQNLKIF